MKLLFSIASKHLLARKRQSIVSLLGIILGVAFFLAISSLMQGSEKDFVKRLVDNSPHITIEDEYREAHIQPVEKLYKGGAVELRSVKPLTETRGIRGYEKILPYIRSIEGSVASPVLTGQALINFAGQDTSITLNGMIPEEINKVSTIEEHMVEGSVDDLIVNPDGIIIGAVLARRLSVDKGDIIQIATTTGTVRGFKVLGIFNTGRSGYDRRNVFVTLKRVQAMLDRQHRINNIIIKLPDPYEAQRIAEEIENRIGYKTVSWQESSEDLMNTLTIRNIIMYTVVSAVLIVAAFGIYNVISTVVMEKQRDISILKSMGFYGSEIKKIFLIQGVLLGLAGSISGVPLGMALMLGMMQIKFRPPGSSDPIQMPVDWSWPQFAIAVTFAMCAAMLAALLPARKAAEVQPVDILRGGT